VTRRNLDFLYLNEPDMIAAGVTDMARCVEVMEEALVLLRTGDFRMAGPTAMSHGAKISFPRNPEFPGMPADGPDRRFMAMPAYLGGRFGTTGVKWYGSNLENRTRGLPRSIHLFTLNDSETGAPLAVMSANLLSAYRTGAVPGVAVKHLAREDARVFGIVGPGVIGRVVTEATLTQRPGIDRLVVKGVDDADVQRYADYIRPRFPHLRSIEAADSVEQVARESDIMAVTATTAAAGSSGFPYIDREWIKRGALLLLPAAVRFDDEFLASGDVRLVVDSRQLYAAWAEEYGEHVYEDIGIVGNRWHGLSLAGRLSVDRIEEIADVATGAIPSRQRDDEIILYSAGGMPIEDVAWATHVYWEALEKGIGVPLNLWESPELA
jgi:ornithine cyclodeaminase